MGTWKKNCFRLLLVGCSISVNEVLTVDVAQFDAFAVFLFSGLGYWE